MTRGLGGLVVGFAVMTTLWAVMLRVLDIDVRRVVWCAEVEEGSGWWSSETLDCSQKVKWCFSDSREEGSEKSRARRQ